MIGILTFHWADDYGAMLQAYALKRYLEKLSGKKVEIIPYAPVKLTGRYWLCPVAGVHKNGKIQYFFMRSQFRRNISFLRKFLKRRKSMREFRYRYLTRETLIKKADKLFIKNYDWVFVGSDQVWNPEITVGLDDAYIGNVKENCKFVSYGASFGNDTLSETYCCEFIEAICHNFSAISLREKSAVPFVKSFFHGKVTDVLDPALLLTRKEWEEIGKASWKKNYILYVYTEYNKQMVQYLQNLSIKLKKKVIQLTMPWPGQKTDWIDFEIEGGPLEYIGFFKNADFVVTNSFHGLVFSVLMEKQFLIFSHSNKNVRIENLVEKLNLKQNLIEYGRIPDEEEILKEIDWECVEKLLEKERAHSTIFIINQFLK